MTKPMAMTSVETIATRIAADEVPLSKTEAEEYDEADNPQEHSEAAIVAEADEEPDQDSEQNEDNQTNHDPLGPGMPEIVEKHRKCD